jgi:LytS/YehU family sensor histidine kinase
VYSNLLGSYFVLNCIIYWAVLGIGYGIQFYRKYREGVLRASHLETQLVQAQLQALKMQLHPHFLFNTLNAISTLVRKNRNKSATDMIAGLSDLLRLTLESVGVQKVPLKQELDFLETYLEIEQTRFEDRLRIQMDIHPDTLEAFVPNLLLQPLVENAIRHGIAPHSSGGCVEIKARRDEDRLWLQVRDDGPGLPEGDVLNTGVGLVNTRARLERLYGTRHRFSLSNAPTGGAVVTLEIPLEYNSLEPPSTR